MLESGDREEDVYDGVKKGSRSGYSCVYSAREKFSPIIKINGKTTYFGSYEYPEEANYVARVVQLNLSLQKYGQGLGSTAGIVMLEKKIEKLREDLIESVLILRTEVDDDVYDQLKELLDGKVDEEPLFQRTDMVLSIV